MQCSNACPLWVKSRHVQCTRLCPLYPRKQTSKATTEMFARGQKRTYGGAVLRIEGRSDIERIHLASCGRPIVRSSMPQYRALSRATARIRCAMRGAPCINGSTIWPSKTSAMRRLRAISWARTVGERSFAGRTISRVHTEMPSHMLRAMNSSRR